MRFLRIMCLLGNSVQVSYFVSYTNVLDVNKFVGEGFPALDYFVTRNAKASLKLQLSLFAPCPLRLLSCINASFVG